MRNLQVRLPPARPHGSSLLLPTSWRLLLKLLLQRGVPAKQLRELCEGRQQGDEADRAVWSVLPPGIKTSWDQAPHRVSSAEAQVLCPCCSLPGFRRKDARETEALRETAAMERFDRSVS